MLSCVHWYAVVGTRGGAQWCSIAVVFNGTWRCFATVLVFMVCVVVGCGCRISKPHGDSNCVLLVCGCRVSLVCVGQDVCVLVWRDCCVAVPGRCRRSSVVVVPFYVCFKGVSWLCWFVRYLSLMPVWREDLSLSVLLLWVCWVWV